MPADLIKGMSPLQKFRFQYKPRVPSNLKDIALITAVPDVTSLEPDVDSTQKTVLKEVFKKTYGKPVIHLSAKGSGSKQDRKPIRASVVLSGGQAPGGHDVIAGIFDALRSVSPSSELIGFLGGPSGILNDQKKTLSEDIINAYRNTGGFDILGSGRTKIEKPEDIARCQEILEKNKIDALIIIGGDDSNTNAAMLAEHLNSRGSPVLVIGVPKTIDGDLKNKFVDISFGFDTASKVYSELIGNIAKDSLSAKKYYHFIRLMGRAASHITLEAALQTHPNVALISEELAHRKVTIRELVEDIGKIVIKRADLGKNFGVILLPEGLIEFLPEVKTLLQELNHVLAEHHEYVNTLRGFTEQSEYINQKLSRDSSYTFSGLPIDIQRQLLMDRDPHGNVQVSQIETEKLIIEMLETYLGEQKAEGRYKGKFAYQRHFLGYEGRCAAPTNFDTDYSYSLGRTAVALILAKANGYMTVVKNLAKNRDQWEALGVPLTGMMNLESRHGKQKPVIKKSLVSLDGSPFLLFAHEREKWALEDDFRFPGAIQYFGPPEVSDLPPISVTLETTEDR